MCNPPAVPALLCSVRPHQQSAGTFPHRCPAQVREANLLSGTALENISAETKGQQNQLQILFREPLAFLNAISEHLLVAARSLVRTSCIIKHDFRASAGCSMIPCPAPSVGTLPASLANTPWVLHTLGHPPGMGRKGRLGVRLSCLHAGRSHRVYFSNTRTVGSTQEQPSLMAVVKSSLPRAEGLR